MSIPIITCLLIISLTLFSPPIGADDSLTAYEVLQKYDFPVGLLPKAVTSYELDTSTGEFTVYLNETCSFTIDGYNLKYKTKITGTISKDKITDLKGIQVKVLFFWLNIVEVTRDGDELEFSVGIVSADFPIDNFEESPQCGCGLDCANGNGFEGEKATEFSFKRLVFSSLNQM
ncbi:unnamed protein product [Fraxinus pennsylvanica]|uniref:DUF538 family protein n=1 Tax=Fraxinus pennsylvanica TaxID=56036 RepID=A0AAD2DRZ2_9LAMI|nr:unnamed protein product [Fraxinus pennsylvanica]